EAAAQVLRAEPFELLRLDRGLPGSAGLELLKVLRERGLTVPVLIITARDAIADRVQGLDAGADDYLTKPFDLDELAARIRALLRRRAGRSAPRIEHLGVVLDPASHRVTQDGVEVSLSPRELAPMPPTTSWSRSGRSMACGCISRARTRCCPASSHSASPPSPPAGVPGGCSACSRSPRSSRWRSR